jgi:hypothetical protein
MTACFQQVDGKVKKIFLQWLCNSKKIRIWKQNNHHAILIYGLFCRSDLPDGI